MANVKISQLTALTTPAAADSLVIVDDSEAASEKTKYITWANLVAAITGAAATYTVTGAYTATMPTNGVAANAKFMLGTSSTITWMYNNTAPPGWKVVVTNGDRVLGISGGTLSYNVSGGAISSPEQWQVSGLTADAHYHAGPSHTHTGTTGLAADWAYPSPGRAGTSGDSAPVDHDHAFTTAAGGSGSTSTASTGGVTSTGAWRPPAYIGKLFQLDTA